MKTTRTWRLSISLFLVFNTYGHLLAGESFIDEFMEPNPTNPNRVPVPWTANPAGAIDVSNGNLAINGQQLIVATVSDFNAEDVVVEAQFRILEGTSAGLGVRFSEGGNDCDFAALNADGIATLFRCGIIPLAEPVETNVDPTQEDVIMRLNAVDDELSLWVWPADAARPDEPISTATASDLEGGTVALYVDADGVTSAEFRYFDVIVPPLGDFNLDGVLSAADIDALTAHLNAGDPASRFDLTGDQLVDQDDRSIWVHDLANTYFGDASLDGEFDSQDLVDVFQSGQYEDGQVGNSTWATGDWNGDGEFASGDFVLAFQDGGYEKGPQAIQAVPEPSTRLLTTTSVIMIGLLAKRRRLH